MSLEQGPVEEGRAGPPRRVWALVFALVSAGVLLWVLDLGDLGVPSGRLHIPWLLLAAGFFAAEGWGGIHMRLHGQEQTIGVGEIPLTLGLLFCSPSELIASTVVGGGLALLLMRGRPVAIKVVFNLGLYALSAAVAAFTFQMLGGSFGTLGPREWAAVIAATLAADVVAYLALTAVFTLTSGTPRPRELVEMLAFGGAETLATTIVALLPATVLLFDVRAAWLLAVPAVSLVMAFKAVARKQVLTERVDDLYEKIRATKLPERHDERAVVLLENARELFNADHAELVLFEPDSVRRYVSPDRSLVEPPALESSDQRLLELVGKRSTLLELPTARRRDVDDALTERGLVRMMATALRGDADLVGLLLVGERIDRLDSVAQDDLLRFEAFATHVNATLQISRLLELQTQLHRDARQDPLTGLGNRLLYRELVQTALAGERRDGLAVLYVDIVDFKRVNGRLGHGAGDRALRTIATRLEHALPPGDSVVRLGGDEFACVLQRVQSHEDAMRRAAQVTAAFEIDIAIDRHTFLLRACVGLSIARAGSTPDELLTEADLALHQAKSCGPGTATQFTADLREAANERRQLEHDLRRGIKGGELETHYQPLIDLSSGRLRGFEALVRWRHPQRGLLSPGAFLPTAEGTGLVRELGREVLRQACLQARKFDALAGTGSALVISVNLASAQLAEADLAATVAAELARSGADPHRLWLEVTETVAMEDVNQTLQRLTELQALGVVLALDDFGTGYSSLSYLKRFPFEVLKIARELIAGSDTVTDDSILEAVVMLANRFDMRIVAEGIEHEDQSKRVRGLGCEIGQGFLWSRPLTPEAAEDIVRVDYARTQLAA